MKEKANDNLEILRKEKKNGNIHGMMENVR